MSNDVVSLNKQNLTPEQMHLITSTVAKGATPDELKLFLYRCQNLGLDPLKPGQIYFIKYSGSAGTIVVGIEGFRARAAKTGKLAGIKRGALRGDKGELIGAYAEVYRSDWKECAREEVPLNEYDTGKGNWVKMPETMIKKVAEAAALRMAFPDDLGGVYTKEEMDQAEQGRIVPDREGAAENGYTEPMEDKPRFTCGYWNKRSFEEVYYSDSPRMGADNLKAWPDNITLYYTRLKKPIPENTKENIARLEAWLGQEELRQINGDDK